MKIKNPHTDAIKKSQRIGLPNDFMDHFIEYSNSIRSRFLPAGFVFDFTINKFLFLEDTCEQILGLPSQYFLSNDAEHFIARVHPEDCKVIQKQVIGNSLKCLHALNIQEYSHYFISYNYRFKTEEGEYKHIFQRFNYIPGEEPGKVYGLAGIIMDISSFKFDNVIIHTIEKHPSPLNASHEVIYKKAYSVSDDVMKPLLSFREVDILKYIANGLASKQIAAIMNISINTVNNHRKNMLQKTNCKNSSELISMAEKNGLLT